MKLFNITARSLLVSALLAPHIVHAGSVGTTLGGGTGTGGVTSSGSTTQAANDTSGNAAAQIYTSLGFSPGTPAGRAFFGKAAELPGSSTNALTGAVTIPPISFTDAAGNVVYVQFDVGRDGTISNVHALPTAY